MTVTTTQCRVSYNGDGVTAAFPIPFMFVLNGDISAILTNASGSAPEIPVVNFSLLGAGQPNGGTYQRTAPLPIGSTLQIFGNPLIEQYSVYSSNAIFPAQSVMADLDRLTLICQRLNDLIGRSLRAPDSDITLAGFLLPPAAQRANTLQGYDANGLPTLLTTLLPGVVLSNATVANVLHMLLPTAAEAAAGATPVDYGYPPNNVLRYGIVPNSPAAAAVNTSIAQALFDYDTPTGPVGDFVFPNTTGADVYYFSDMITFRPGCHLHVNGCTLNCTRAGLASDVNAGFIFAVTDFSMEDYSIVLNYTGGVSSFAAVQLGGRDVPIAGSELPTLFDSLLPAPMGNIRLKNGYITSNNPGGYAIQHLGGIVNMTIDGLAIDGQSQLAGGIYGEFGWATNQANEYQRQTSHPHNLTFRNIRVKFINTGNAGNLALGCNGGYNIKVDGLYVNGSPQVCTFGSGEALFYNPWSGVDDIGNIGPNGRTIRLRNIVGRGITGTAITANGATNQSGGYLNGHGPTEVNEVDQLNLDLEGFVIDGGPGGLGGYGVQTSAGISTIRNGKITNFQRGIVTQSPCTFFTIEDVTVLNCSSFGMQLGQSSGTIDPYSPARQAIGHIRGSFVAGSGSGSTPCPGIVASNFIELIIEGNRFGYETIHDNQVETAQTSAVSLDSTCFGVKCSNNYVAGVEGGAVAYAQVGGSNSNGNTVERPQGIATVSGFWDSHLAGCSADRGNVSSVALTPGADFATQIFNTPLTQLCTVTPSTTGAGDSTKWRIVRTAAATGSFNITIGAKNLTAAGQWTEVQYDTATSAYVETGGGTL